MPLGVVYAIWSGAGIVLVTLIGWSVFRQMLDLPAVIGIAMILGGRSGHQHLLEDRGSLIACGPKKTLMANPPSYARRCCWKNRIISREASGPAGSV